MLFLEKVDQKKVYIILVLLVSMLIGGIYSLIFVPKTQIASTTLLCLKVESNEDGTIKSNSTLELNDKMVANFEEIAKSQLTIDDANKDINMNVKSNQIKFTKVSDSDTFNIELKNIDKENIVNFSNSLVEVFSKKVEDLVGNIEIYVVDTPHIKAQSLGNSILFYPLFGLVIGIGISLLYILVLISLERKIKNSKEIETELALKNLCYIPVISKKKNIELIYNEKTQPEFSNIFNTLRANIQFVNVNNKNKNTILITSPKKDEGKSFVAVNLAAAFAQIGKKVILIDADMNLGRLDKIFNVPNGLGFSNYLANLDDNGLEINELVNKYIKETGIKNLNLITSGTVPPNSAELLASPRLEELIKDLTVFYDVVILDGASALIRTDSLILARNINSTILVSNLNKTDKDDLWQVKKDIQNVGGRIIGNVLNKTRDKQLKLRIDPSITKVKHKHSKQDFEKVIFKVKEKLLKLKDIIANMINKSGQKLLSEAKGKEIIDINPASPKVETNLNINENNYQNVQDNTNINIVKEEQELSQNKEIKEPKENPIVKLGSDVKGMFKNFNLLNAAKGWWVEDDTYTQEERVIDPKKVQEAQDNINQDEFKFEEVEFENKENQVKENTVEVQTNIIQPPEIFNDIYEKSKVVLDKSKDTINSFSDKFKGLFIKKDIPEVDVNKIDEAIIAANQELNKSINTVNEPSERKIVDDIKLTEITEEEKEKNKIAEDLRNNEDSVLVLIDGENGMCRVFNKYCCLDKPIRGIDSVDGIEKANYSAYVLKKYSEKLIKEFDLTQNQISRIDILIYLSLKDYDDKIWLKRKIASTTAEDYIKCMSINYEYGIGETELGYIRRCQDSRRNELRKRLIEIEYKLDNMWSSKKMTITDKLVLNKFAGNFDCDNKLKLFVNELIVNDKKESKTLKGLKKVFDQVKDKVIDLREKYLKIKVEQVEVKSIEELQKEIEIEQKSKNTEEVKTEDDSSYLSHLYDTYNYDEPSLNISNNSTNINSSLNYNKEEADRLREIELLKEKKREEKAILKQMKAEERKAKKIERLKKREEQRKNKELEKEKHKQEVRIEEELLGDNLYPKTKNNKDI